jgi:chromosome segregation ATPase
MIPPTLFVCRSASPYGMIEILVQCRGGRSTISFDALPTFAKFRRAVAVDVVGSDAFQMIGTTQRGTSVVIKDQASFIRALGPRNELTVQIREQLDAAATTSTPQQQPPAVPAGSSPVPHASRSESRASTALAPPPSSGAAGRTGSAAPSERRSSASPSRRRNNAAPGAADAPSKHGLQCTQVQDAGSDARCAVFAKASHTVWVGERTTGHITVRDASKGTVLRSIDPWHSLSGPQVGCLSLAYVPPSRDGGCGSSGQVWAGFNNKQIKVFDAQTMDELKTLVEHSGAVVALEFAGSSVFSASVDFTILQWNPDTLALTRLLARHRNGVRALCTGPMQRLISCGDDQSIIAWHAHTGEVVAEVHSAHPCGIHAVTFHRRKLWTGDERGGLKAWAVTYGPAGMPGEPSAAMGSITLSCVGQVAAHDGSITGIRGFNDRVVSFGQDRTIRVFDAESVAALGHVMHPHDSPVSCLAATAAMQVFRFWTGGGDGKWCQWSLEAALASADGAGTGTTTLASPSGASYYADPSRSVTPAPFAMQRSEHEREQDRRLAVAHLEAEALADRALIGASEGEARANLSFLAERVLRERFFMHHRDGAAHAAAFALQAHSDFCATALDNMQLTVDMIRTHVDAANAVAMANTAVLEQERGNFDKYRRDTDRTKSLLQEQLKAAHEELASTHDEYEAAAEKRDSLESALTESEAKSAGLSEELRHSREEHQAAAKRARSVEEQLAQAHESHAASRRQQAEDAARVEAQWQERVDDLSQRNLNLGEQLETAEREERRRKQELAAEREATESLQKRLAQQAELQKQLEEQRVAAADKDRAFWQQQVEQAEGEVSELKRRLDGQSTETGTEITRLTTEVRELKVRNRQAQDENQSLSRRLDTAQHEAAAELAALRQQLDEVRASWRSEVDSLEAQCGDKASKLAAAEATVREKDSTLAAVRASMQTQQHKLDLAEADSKRAKDAHASEVADLEARLHADSDLITTLKSDMDTLEANLSAERAGHNDAELRLAALEDSYEGQRRRAAEELQSARDTHLRESSALAAKYKSLCEESEAAQRDLSTELQALRAQCAAHEHSYETLQSELAASQESSDFATRKNTQLTQQLADTETRARDEQAQLKRALDLRRKELEEVRESANDEAQRLRAEVAERVAAEEELADAIREVDSNLATCRSELEAERRKTADLGNDFRRLSERSNSEKAAFEAREEQSVESLRALREEHSALLATHDTVVDERDAALRGKKDAEATLAATKDELSRATTRHASQMHERDTTIESLRGDLRDAERTVGQLRSTHHELEADIANLKRQHSSELEDRRRQARAELDDVRDMKERAEAQHKRVASQLATLKEEHDELRAATDRKQHELEAAIADHTATISRLQSELQDTKSTLAAERERNGREVRSLRENLEEQTNAAHAERRRHDAAVEERRLADKRFADAMDQHRATSGKEVEALQAALAQEKQSHSAEVDSLEAANKQLREECQGAKETAEALRLTIDEKDQLLALAQRDLDHQTSMLRGENETLKRQAAAQQMEAHDTQTRLQRDLDSERDAVQRERAEAQELQSTIRQLEAQLAALRVETERDERKIADLTSETRRLSERGASDREQAEVRFRDLSDTHDAAKAELLRLQEALDAKALEVMKLETESRDGQEKQRQLTDQVDTWKKRASEAQVAKEKALADSAAERVALEEKRLEEANKSHDEIVALQSQLKEGGRKHDELDRENARLRRNVVELQCQSEDTARKSMDSLTVAEAKAQGALDELDDLRGKYNAALDERRRAIELANDHEASSKSLQRQLQDAEDRAEAEASASRSAAETYSQCIAGIEEDCATLRHHIDAITREKEELQASLAATHEDQLRFERSLAHAMSLADTAAAGMEAKKTFVDDLVNASDVAIREARTECDRQVAISHRQSGSVAEETRRLTLDVQAARQERDDLRERQARADQLLEDVRGEIASLYQRYKDECDAHDKTRTQLMGAKAAGDSSASRSAESLTVHYRELELQLRGKIQALEADRDAANLRCDSLQADLREARRSGGDVSAASPVQRSYASQGVLGTPSRSPAEEFILRSRGDLVNHLNELIQGLSEASRLLAGLNRSPPEWPDHETLRCLHGWLASARTRGEVMERTLLTDTERVGGGGRAASSAAPYRSSSAGASVRPLSPSPRRR